MKKILVFTRHFPPEVSGGARRPLLLVQGLISHGCDVRVVAPDLPEEIKGVAVPHPATNPNELRQNENRPHTDENPTTIRNWVRANFFLPDPDIRWSLRAARAAKQLVDFTPDWIISTSPPESVHVAACIASRDCNCHWAADFRDHWLVYPLIDKRTRPLRKAVERRFAKILLGRSNLVFSPEEAMLDEIKNYAPKTPSLHLPQAGPNLTSSKPDDNKSGNQINLLHSGSFSLSHDKRLIDPTLDFFKQARHLDERMQLMLIGRLSAEEINKAKAIAGVEIKGLQTLEETWDAQAKADILLLVAAPDARTPPGKYAEYRAAKKPIVFIGGNSNYRSKFGGDIPALKQLEIAKTASLSALATKTPTPEAIAETLLREFDNIEKVNS